LHGSFTTLVNRKAGTLLAVYFVNASLLLCHEIDSAVWKEWDLFHLPGGGPGFVALHLALVPLVLWGLVAIARRSRSARALALLVGLGGLAGAVAHATFLLSGDLRFATPLSEALIVAFGVASLMQIVLAATR
jgi:hypothetical protein